MQLIKKKTPVEPLKGERILEGNEPMDEEEWFKKLESIEETKLDQGKKCSAEFFFFPLIFITIFGDDFKVLFLTKSQDRYLDYVLISIIGIFFLEMVFKGIVQRKKYILASIFLIDFVSTCSIVLDLSPISRKIAEM